MALEFKLPDIGEGVHEGEIVQWLVAVGDTVREDQALLEVMTDKVTAEIPAPTSGVITALNGNAGDVIEVGTVIAVIDNAAGGSAKTAVPAENVATEEANEAASTPKVTAACAVGQAQANVAAHTRALGKVLAAPATRKLARTLGVDLTLISGSGPRGRVTPEDVKAFSGNTDGGTVTIPALAGVASVTIPGDSRKPFTGIRRKIAEHLSLSKQKAPHFAYVDEVDVTDLVAIRKQLKSMAEAQGVKLTFLPFVMRAVSIALTEFPVLNATLDEAAGELIFKGAHNLGVAVDTSSGLVVPVVPKAQGQSVFALASSVQSVSEKARMGKLTPTDMSGGTFTLTSIGSIGGLFGVPIINYPEVAILGVNKIATRPMVVNGQIVAREVMYLSLSCDHRVVDGADAARFVNRVKALLEAPAQLLV